MTSGAVRVVSFNIRNGLAWDGLDSWPLRRRATAATLARLDGDVVGLQEVYWCQRRWLLGRLDGYEARGQGRDGGRRGEACPVLARAGRVRVVEAHTRWFGSGSLRPGARMPGATSRRVATLATLQVAGWDEPVLVVNTHLDEKVEANRVASAEALATWVAGARAVVVTGDLNATWASAPLERLAEAGLVAVLPEGGTAHQFRGGTDGAAIDHILVRGLRATAAGIDTHRHGGRLPSDHWPVWADLVPDAAAW